MTPVWSSVATTDYLHWAICKGKKMTEPWKLIFTVNDARNVVSSSSYTEYTRTMKHPCVLFCFFCFFLTIIGAIYCKLTWHVRYKITISMLWCFQTIWYWSDKSQTQNDQKMSIGRENFIPSSLSYRVKDNTTSKRLMTSQQKTSQNSISFLNFLSPRWQIPWRQGLFILRGQTPASPSGRSWTRPQLVWIDA